MLEQKKLKFIGIGWLNEQIAITVKILLDQRYTHNSFNPKEISEGIAIKDKIK
jgi:hypothetical protein